MLEEIYYMDYLADEEALKEDLSLAERQYYDAFMA